MKKLYVIGLGPGNVDMMTVKAQEAIKSADAIAGYNFYIDLVKSFCDGKEIIKNGMRQEKERCLKALEKANEGKTVAMVCSGDAGLYGMAGLIYELQKAHGYEAVSVEAIPGVTAALSSSALLGAPIVEDFCTISLSDYMTPFDKIFKRVEYAAMSDFTMALYNPRSKARPDYLQKAIEIILQHQLPSTPVGIVKNAYRETQDIILTTLGSIDYEKVDMFSTLVIGNSTTRVIDGKMVSSRGYKI